MEPLSLPALRRVAVCGGTHGNEMTGIYLVQEMQRKQRENGDNTWPAYVKTVLSNPKAVKECRRYIERDLNRCFTSAILSSSITETTPYEVQRAHELNAILGPKGSSEAFDLVCDLHNTTANMGVTVIAYTTKDYITMHIFKYLQAKISSVPVRLLMLDIPIPDAYSLESVGKHGFALEIGPQPNGVVRADVFNVMKEALLLALDWVQLFNSGSKMEGGQVEVFSFQKSVDYPRDPETRQITSAIHPQLQDKDFCLLQAGDPLFLSFSGETTTYQEREPLYPIFINECAYYEKGVAFQLVCKRTVNIPPVQIQKD
ncbi:N-acyl-aromatic-L-amino acid amidohydrolase (carboxylate-forming) A-like [Denticeps clupeoides]|uniref:N-acyl-aromatic-L-amino acid amidohydrolase n=1 Tax=Denticeps clupeoides TaxID=299321 RepID=A0A8C4BRN1_9TELE|nr:N-acyl-aromatic-L-amino acid amidohydrolase (carboxylate-forming) A-like [Denticeps clupeoides]XP_028834278.1 N-acyl-aromatic-L-amino acid amidohydrolase (carboxylate-forming) A-like [Denticeps clupeoides]XP_028834279.1 N-acyl-aromatic-L-amino acid amidohydrolase (carboxylate-forming) A-like [Denticeps clupeoides]